MAHEDVRYYRGQYKERLLPLLREFRVREEDSTNSFICLLKKMKEVRLMEKVVEEKEEAFMERMEALAEQWRHLHTRRAQLKAHVVRSGSTVKENERLRTQALKKAREEKEQNTKKESELLGAKRELEALTKQHQKLSKKLVKYSLFKRYLENVVENSQEGRWAELQDRAARKAVELKSLSMAIHSLFQAASTQLQPKGKVAAGDSHRQLDMIQQFIHDLHDFTEDMKSRSQPQ
ncbi:coiled-coil domain-containing protein 42 [Corvus kubaryi]|uniref:coiled-coil domain-containing protein 42 n=1 Tax=Corvus kubaryi TaxID=68294 RepID=UPI001C050710|nr:coiled-coil domain-containing protein 42 [Corvus kubaryi]